MWNLLHAPLESVNRPTTDIIRIGTVSTAGRIRAVTIGRSRHVVAIIAAGQADCMGLLWDATKILAQSERQKRGRRWVAPHRK